jgi:osmotically-inducible protein OsmY
MSQPIRTLLAFGIALGFVASQAPEASAQSPADAKRTLKIWKALYKEPGFMEVDARYMRGTVLMTGDVASEELMQKANEIVEKQRGVKDLRNRLRVREPDVAAAPCDSILAKIEEEIQEDEELAQGRRKYEIVCEDSNVTISGKLNDYTLASSLLNEIRKIDGVVSMNFDKLKY